jgi:hypothetical protein
MRPYAIRWVLLLQDRRKGICRSLPLEPHGSLRAHR